MVEDILLSTLWMDSNRTVALQASSSENRGSEKLEDQEGDMREVDLQGISTLMQHPVTGQGLVYSTQITNLVSTFIFTTPSASKTLLPHHPYNPTVRSRIQDAKR